jgi:hypothetical protein
MPRKEKGDKKKEKRTPWDIRAPRIVNLLPSIPKS